MRHIAMILVASVFVWSCSKQDGYDGAGKELVPVTFSSTGVDVVPATRATSHLIKGSTMRVLVYQRPALNTPINDPLTDAFIDQNTYKVVYQASPERYSMVETLVDEFGQPIDGSAPMMYLPAGAYDFYAYSWALPIPDDDRPYVRVGHGHDFTSGMVTSEIVTGRTQVINLNTFTHKCSNIYLTLKADPSNTRIDSIMVLPAGIMLDRITANPARFTLGETNLRISSVHNGDYTAPDSLFAYAKKVDGITDDSLKISGSAIVLPKSSSEFDIYFNAKANNNEKLFKAVVPAMEFHPGYRYIFSVIITNTEAILELEILPWDDSIDWSDQIGTGNGVNIGHWENFDQWTDALGGGNGSSVDNWVGNPQWSTDMGVEGSNSPLNDWANSVIVNFQNMGQSGGSGVNGWNASDWTTTF